MVDLLHDGVVGVLGRLRRCLPRPHLPGRTIRGFIMGVLVVPSVVFFTWFTVFGGTAIHVDMFEGGNIGAQTAADINSAFFATLDYFPFATRHLGRRDHPGGHVLRLRRRREHLRAQHDDLGRLADPRRSVLILWGVLTGLTAIVLMLAGGLNALQNTVIVTSRRSW